MGIIQRQALLNTIINYAGVLIGFLLVVVLFPLFLSQEEFGLTRLVLSLTTIIAQLATFGGSRIAIKFFPTFRTAPHKNNGLLISLLLLSSFGFLLFSFIYFILKEPILYYYQDESSLFSTYYAWVPLASLGFLLFLVFESFLQALRKTVFTNLLRNVIIRIYWLVSLLLYYYGYYSFFTFMMIYMLGYFLTAALCVVQLMKSKEFIFDVNPYYTQKRIIKPMLNYGFYTLFSNATLILVVSIDLLMIGALLPESKLKYVGIYAIATYVVSIIFIPSTSLARIASPIIAYDWRKRNLKSIDEFYKKSSVILIFLGGIIFGCIFLNIDDMLSFMKPEYAEAKNIIIVLGISRLLDMAFGLNYVILVITKFYRAESIFAISLLILIILSNLIFIPIYGIFGAAMATAGVYLFFNFIMFIFIHSKLNLQPFTIGTLQMTVLGLISGTIVYFLPLVLDNKIILILLKSTLFSVIYILPVYYFKISIDINEIMDKYLLKKWIK